MLIRLSNVRRVSASAAAAALQRPVNGAGREVTLQFASRLFRAGFLSFPRGPLICRVIALFLLPRPESLGKHDIASQAQAVQCVSR